MTEKEKAQEAVELLKDAVCGVLKRNKKMRLREIDEALGLDFDLSSPRQNLFIRKFIEGFLMDGKAPVGTNDDTKKDGGRFYFWTGE